MIVYDLICGEGHTFKGCFESVDDYNTQKNEVLFYILSVIIQALIVNIRLTPISFVTSGDKKNLDSSVSAEKIKTSNL